MDLSDLADNLRGSTILVCHNAAQRNSGYTELLQHYIYTSGTDPNDLERIVEQYRSVRVAAAERWTRKVHSGALSVRRASTAALSFLAPSAALLYYTGHRTAALITGIAAGVAAFSSFFSFFYVRERRQVLQYTIDTFLSYPETIGEKIREMEDTLRSPIS